MSPYNFTGMTAVEARLAIKARDADAPRALYAALAYRTWAMLVSNAPEDELRDWHDLLCSVKAFVRRRDDIAAERISVLADLLRESISSYTTFGIGNKVARAMA